MMDQVIRAIQDRRLPLESETAMQDALQALLEQALPAYKITREFRLDAKNRLDFLIHKAHLQAGVAIECKLRAQPQAVFRQIKRYLACERVNGLILVTAKSMGLPAEYNGKPLAVVNPSQAWL